MRRVLTICAVLAAGIPLLGYVFCVMSGCDGGDRARSGSDSEGSGRPVIVASIYPLADLTRQIVGDDVEVICMLDPGESPHHYEPTARQMNKLTRAKLVVRVGLNLDGWVVDAVEATGRNDLSIFTVGQALKLGEDRDEHDEHAHGHEDEHAHDHNHSHAHDHGGVDPHVWLDPVLMRQAVEHLGERLEEVLPERAQRFRAGMAQLADELRTLDQDYQDQLKPYQGRMIVAHHGAFNRLAERYGLEIADTLVSVESAGGETLGALRQAMETIRSRDLKVVFTEPQFPPDAAEMLRRETGVAVLTLDPLGGPTSEGRRTYQELMRYNLRVLVKGLSLNGNEH